MQVLDPKDLDNFDFNPLDATKDWFEDVFPYEHVGTMTLDRNPDNILRRQNQLGLTLVYLYAECYLLRIVCCKVVYSRIQIRKDIA